MIILVAIRLDAVPVAGNHRCKPLEWLQSLPAQRLPPLLEETPRPARRAVIPQLAEGFLEEVSRVQPLVRLEQQSEGRPSVRFQVPPMSQQRVPLPLDEAPVLPSQAAIL